MSKRPTAKQAANEPYWFAKDQEVSKAVTPMTDPEFKHHTGRDVLSIHMPTCSGTIAQSIGPTKQPASFGLAL